AVDANKGSQAELEAVKGIGPAISTLIINERKKGNFKDWNDMVVRVKGVGDKNAAKFSEGGLTVNGAAFAGAPAKTEASMPSRAATATKATASKAASAVKGGAAVVAGDVKEQKDAVKENVKDAKEKRAEKKAEKAEKKAEKAAAASAASSTKK
ncbi:MAG: helix-hairpin-helix domain-containing protein, partial [Caldimonas sp.]